MSILTIPNMADELARRLRIRAEVHGRSVEEEARSILANALVDDATPVIGNMADAIRAIMVPVGGVDLPPFPDEPVKQPIRLD